MIGEEVAIETSALDSTGEQPLIDESVPAIEQHVVLPPSQQQVERTMADRETNGAEVEAPPQVAEGGEEAAQAERPKKNQKPKEPPVTFREFNVRHKHYQLCISFALV